MVYGIRSGGTCPSTRAMTKNSLPMWTGSDSYQRSGGSGTEPSVARPTRCMTSYCSPRS